MIVRKIKSSNTLQVAVYVAATYLFSWIIWGIIYVSYRNIISYNIYKNYSELFFAIGALMPTIMAISFTGFFYGSDGVRNLLKKGIIWRINPLYYVFILFYVVSSFFIPLWFCNITGSSYNFDVSINFNSVLINFFVVLFLGGPLGEEFGWRGFVLTKLQNKLNPIYSSVILGVIWACWHLPLFFIHGTPQYGIPFSLFMISVMCLSIVFTWIYNRTHGSVLMTILLHTLYNITPIINPDFVKNFNRYTATWIIYQLIIILFIIWDMIKKTSKK
ncbi:CPBP family intramembrane glutamic endopeptidase [Clostridium sp. C8-1-8]|uniref:CPBP family intramembrane glutamic endopeptidase n=1 Tax=Clostridium sp. C8-1-8 TaxID=2698831 RepID=UPI00136D8135|nr:CPBP family intramembrane glutamic endopeptidase [Clostridium sp. C8-1-8]